MITTHNHKGLVWLDLHSPSETEITGLIKRYGLNPLVGEELASETGSTRVNFYKDYLLIVLTLPVRVRRDETYEIVDRELDVVIGKNFLITSCVETIEQIEYFAKIFDANTVLDKNTPIDHAGHLFYYIIKRIYTGMYQDLENIRDSLRSAELHIFNGEEKAMVEKLSDLSRELIDFKQTAHSHHDIWGEISKYAEKGSLFGSEFQIYVQAVKDEAVRINELIVNSRELLADLRETNNSLLDSRQNEIIKVLTLVSFIFYPLTFIASVFTIPGVHVPFTESQSGWWIIASLMVIVTVGIWMYFKKQKWV